MAHCQFVFVVGRDKQFLLIVSHLDLHGPTILLCQPSCRIIRRESAPSGSFQLARAHTARKPLFYLMTQEPQLADRLGLSVHVSPLRFKIRRIRAISPSSTAATLEDWLVDVANIRGARIVTRGANPAFAGAGPPESDFSNEELVVALCQLQALDRPQMLRLAGQLISRETVDFGRLKSVAIRERATLVLTELAHQALHVDPRHGLWKELSFLHPERPQLRGPVLHWTRLAEPVPVNGLCNAELWRLVA